MVKCKYRIDGISNCFLWVLWYLSQLWEKHVDAAVLNQPIGRKEGDLDLRGIKHCQFS